MNCNVDIILHIDSSSSMHDSLEKIKTLFGISFWNDFTEAFNNASKIVTSVRIKLITLGTDTIDVSRWYNISNNIGLETEFFNSRLGHIKCTQIASATRVLEVLSIEALTIKSAWMQTDDRCRHMIVMFIGASTRKLEEATHPILIIQMICLILLKNLANCGCPHGENNREVRQNLNKQPSV